MIEVCKYLCGGIPTYMYVWKYCHICVKACKNLHGVMTTSKRRHAQFVRKHSHIRMNAYPNILGDMAIYAWRHGHICKEHSFVCIEAFPILTKICEKNQVNIFFTKYAILITTNVVAPSKDCTIVL